MQGFSDNPITANVLVSVVTTVYNQANTLRETIESVLAQTYPNIEYIVINDGSTDGTKEVLCEYKDIVRVITQPNSGQATALNRAWSLASGEYFTYLSADDILYPNCIETLVGEIDEEAVVYYPDFDLIDLRSDKIRTAQMQDYDAEDLICGLVCQPGLAALFRADVYRSIGGWDPTYRFIADFEFWARMASRGIFKHIPKVLGGFRVHEGSSSVRNISATASDEIVRFVDEFTTFPMVACKQRAMFRSRLISARSHFQSRRISLGVQRYLQAFMLSPLTAIKPENVKFVVTGLVRRMYYHVKAVIPKRK